MQLFQTLITVAAAVLGINKQVCYHSYGIGCFSNTGPYDNAGHYVPQSPSKIRQSYFLYTRQTLEPTKISETNLPNFDGNKKTKFIIHGYRGSGFDNWVREMRTALLKREDMNVIVVNWEHGADQKMYKQAAANTRVVGALIARLITALHDVGGASYADIHLIGHSLGAHVAGYAGERIPGLGRITGLDPAGPAFGEKHPRARLDPCDALFVDVIHTDAEKVIYRLGLRQPIGHADFYPNGGKKQPGCANKKGVLMDLVTLRHGIRTHVRRTSCSHLRSRDYFTESINSDCHFKSYPCQFCRSCGPGCAYMGYDADMNNPRGRFYLTTRASPRFCIA